MNANPEKIQELIDMQEDPKVKADLQREWNTFQKHYTVVAAPAKPKDKDKRRTKAKAAKQARKQNRKK
ncbi:hypothetical protein SAMN02799624_05369 [Paenibacillus sp. UNC496MF]|uniref:hypothetical protein n=1 Tax=Paenibacillus sp. UNC496MF TaxID=1502753 RepID=UPI0008EF849E|nr:hypothetical protein [Paenibacillus sp. UNC496MF]SFJ64905.1 hypothetical protein SAMN02799624_05369 [Paenibacillus sp. UNC496MF]